MSVVHLSVHPLQRSRIWVVNHMCNAVLGGHFLLSGWPLNPISALWWPKSCWKWWFLIIIWKTNHLILSKFAVYTDWVSFPEWFDLGQFWPGGDFNIENGHFQPQFILKTNHSIHFKFSVYTGSMSPQNRLLFGQIRPISVLVLSCLSFLHLSHAGVMRRYDFAQPNRLMAVSVLSSGTNPSPMTHWTPGTEHSSWLYA